MQKFLENIKGEGAIEYETPTTSDNASIIINTNSKEEDPLKILKMRLVKGEITEEEYNKTKSLLDN